MKNQRISPKLVPQVTIGVSGKLFQGHLPYLEQLVHSAAECHLWPVLTLSNLEELDHAALFFLMNGENQDFGIEGCPSFIRQRINQQSGRAA